MLFRNRFLLCVASPAPHPFTKILGGATHLLRNRHNEPMPIDEALPISVAPASADGADVPANTPTVSSNSTTANKYVMLYFSAHWCPPCRQFTPILSKFYNDHKKKKAVEVVFCSWDQNDAEFASYFSSHPEWLAVDRALVDTIATTYNIQTIPSLLVFDAQSGELVTRKGRLGVAHDPAAKEFPWKGNKYTSHVNVNAPTNAVIIGGVATFGASVLLWMFAQDSARTVGI